jgi:DNA repair exonuclease SbcCD ATPase subunit
MTTTDLLTALSLDETQSAELISWISTRESELNTEKTASVAAAKQAEIDRFSAIQSESQDAHDAELEALADQLDTANARVESLQSQLATAQGEASNVPNLQSQLETALARIAELEAVPEVEAVGGVSKLTIMRRLGDKWPTLKASLLTLPELVQDAWLLAQEIRADDELILTYGETLKGFLDLTDEEFTALLTP